MAAPASMNGPVYSAYRHSSPAVLKALPFEEIKPLKKLLSGLLDGTQQMQTATSGKVSSAQSSIFTNSYTHLSPAGTWIVAFGTLLISTYDGWEDRSSGNNALQVVGLVSMVGSVLHTGIVYWRNKRQSELAQARMDNLLQLQTIFNSLAFLRESARMAKACLKTNPPANLPEIYPVFDKYLNALPAGYVPNDLAMEWREVGQIIHSAGEVNLPEALAPRIQDKILPMIKHYSDGLQQHLVGLGYAPAGGDEAHGGGGEVEVNL